MGDDDSGDPLRLVSSVYGPGTIYGWLLVMISLMISWYHERDSFDGDAMTVDLAAVLLLPVVAATHILQQVAHLPDASANITEGQIAAHKLALDAPLRVCTDFMTLFTLLFSICYLGSRRQTRVWKHRLYWLSFVHTYCMVVIAIAQKAGGARVHWPETSQQLDAAWIYAPPQISALILPTKLPSTALAQYRRQTLPSVGRQSRNSWWAWAMPHMLLVGTEICWVEGIFIHMFGNGVVPESETKLSDLDQAIALVGGIFAIGSSIRPFLPAFPRVTWRIRAARAKRLDLLEVEV